MLTLQVFAPLARLLGLYSIKEELEALSFRHSQPEAHSVRTKPHDSPFSHRTAVRNQA